MTYRPSRQARSVAVLLLFFLATLSAVAFGAEPVSGLPLRTGGSFDLWRTAVKAIGVAVLCLALVAAALYAWRHRLVAQGDHVPGAGVAAHIEWARRVSPRTTLLVVRWQGQHYLLAENGGTTQLIDRRPTEPRT